MGGYLQAMALAIPLGFLVGLIPFFRHLVSKQIELSVYNHFRQQRVFFMALFGLGLGVKVESLPFGIFCLPASCNRSKNKRH